MSEKQSNKERIKEITAGIKKGIMELFEAWFDPQLCILNEKVTDLQHHRADRFVPFGSIAAAVNYIFGISTRNREPLQSIRPAFFSLLISADMALRSTPR